MTQMLTTDLHIGKVYRQKPNAQDKSWPQIVIVLGYEPHKVDVLYGTFVDEETFRADVRYFCSRYFEVKEDWHLQGL